MEFTLDGYSIKRAISRVEKATDGIGHINRCITIRTESNGNIILSAFNGTISLCDTIDSVGALADATYAVDGTMFANVVKKLDGDISFDFGAKTVKITTDKTFTELPLFNVDEIPTIHFPNDNNAIPLPAEGLRESIRKVLTCVSHDDSRPILKGVNFACKDNKLNIVTLDGYKLAKCTIELGAGTNDFNVTVPSDTIGILAQLIADTQTDIMLSIDTARGLIFVGFDTATMCSPTINDTYVDYARILSVATQNTFTANAKEWIKALDFVSTISKINKNLTTLTFGNSNITVSATFDCGNIESSFDISDSDVCEGFNIAFSSAFLISVLKTIKQDTVCCQLSKQTSPMILTADNCLFLVLPVRITA